MLQTEQQIQEMKEVFALRRKRDKQEQLFSKIVKRGTLICLVLFVIISVWALIIGQPIVILASIVIPLFIGVVCGGFDLKDIVTLVWWDSGIK